MFWITGIQTDSLDRESATHLHCQAFLEKLPLRFLETLKFTHRNPRPVSCLRSSKHCVCFVFCRQKRSVPSLHTNHTTSNPREVTEVLGLSPGILKWVKLIDNFEGEYDYVTNEGTVFTFKTNRHSPNYRLINIDFTDPEESRWKVLVPEHEKDVLGKSMCCLKVALLFLVRMSRHRCISHSLVTGYKVKNLQLMILKSLNGAAKCFIISTILCGIFIKIVKV